MLVDHTENPEARKRVILGRGLVPRTCRFCGGARPQVTFRRRAHVIAEALGNRTLLSAEECDGCNERAGQSIEQCLVNSLAAVRPISLYRSGHGRTAYRPAGQESVLRSIPERNVVRIDMPSAGGAIAWDGISPTESKLTVPIPPFSMANVARALARMCVFLAGDVEAGPVRHLLPWIRGEESRIPIRIYRLFKTRNLLPGVRLTVLQGRHVGGSTRHLVALQYHSAAYLLELPDRSWQQREQIRVHQARRWMGGDANASLYELRVESEGKVTGVTESYTISHGPRELIDDPETRPPDDGQQ